MAPGFPGRLMVARDLLDHHDTHQLASTRRVQKVGASVPGAPCMPWLQLRARWHYTAACTLYRCTVVPVLSYEYCNAIDRHFFQIIFFNLKT